jgi:hypothetical protein
MNKEIETLNKRNGAFNRCTLSSIGKTLRSRPYELERDPNSVTSIAFLLPCTPRQNNSTPAYPHQISFSRLTGSLLLHGNWYLRGSLLPGVEQQQCLRRQKRSALPD